MDNTFEEKLKKAEKNAYRHAKIELENAKLNVAKQLLKEKGIIFDESIDNLRQLKSEVIALRPKKLRNEINAILNETNNKLEQVLVELQNGSTNAFTKFLKKSYKEYLKPIAKGITNSLAIRTALILAPTVESKIVVGSAIAANTVYKLHKVNKYKNIIDKNHEINSIIDELEISKDINGNITDTRFNEKLQSIITEYLESLNIKSSDYHTLKQNIYSLPFDSRVALANILNNHKGNQIDILKRLKPYEKTLRQRFTQGIITPITIGGTSGAAIATSINAINPALTVAPVNAVGLGTLVSKLSDSPVAGWITGVLGGIGTAIGQYIPILGEYLDNVFAAENLILGAILGGSIGLVGSIAKKIVNKVQKTKEKNELKKQKKLANNIDEKLYPEKRNATPSELAIIGIVKRMLNELKIKYPEINTINELKEFIKDLDHAKRRQLLFAIKRMEEIHTNDPLKFTNMIKKLSKTLYWTVTLGLASLSIIDILSGCQMLEEISEKILESDLKTITPLENKPEVIELADVPNPTPAPAPTPAPPPPPVQTPAPTPTPPPEIIEIEPKLSVHEIQTSFINDTKDFISTLNNDKPSIIYEKLQCLGEPRFIDHTIKKMDIDSLRTLIEYLNKTERKTTLVDSFINNSLNDKISSINDYVNGVKQTTRTIAKIQEPITTIIDFNDKKTKTQV